MAKKRSSLSLLVPFICCYFSWSVLLKLCYHFIKFSDYYHLKNQIESEFVDSGSARLSKSFLELPKLEQQAKLKERLKKYCQKVYWSLFTWMSESHFWHILILRFFRLINEYLISQSMKFEKQGSAWEKTLSILTLFVGTRFR